MEQHKQSEELLFLLKSLGNQMTQCFERKTAISLTRYELLRLVAKKDRVLQGDLQKALKIDQGAITRHLKILEEKGYITRQRNPENNREVHVEISSTGRQLMESCQPHTVNTLEQFYQGLGEEQRGDLLMLLKTIAKNVNTME